MKLMKIVAGATTVAALALLVMACSSSPLGAGTGPSAVAGLLATVVGTEDCSNGIDDNKDKLVDCDDPGCAASAPECQKTPPPPPPGTGCSPGFYKNHTEFWINNTSCCTGSACQALLNALNCRGSDASCGRSAAAATLDACTGCSE